MECKQEENCDVQKLHKEHKIRLLKQRLKIQKEYERMFRRYFNSSKFIKYINEWKHQKEIIEDLTMGAQYL